MKQKWKIKNVIIWGILIGVAYYFASIIVSGNIKAHLVRPTASAGMLTGSAIGGVFWALVVNAMRNLVVLRK